MKNIKPKLIRLFKYGYCTPQIAKIAKKISEPATTIHYNIKNLENEGIIKTYKAVFDYKKIDEGFCAYLFINLLPAIYRTPEETGRRLTKQNLTEIVAKNFAKYDEVESADIITGDWNILMKVRTKDQEEYYKFLRDVIYVTEGFKEAKSMVSLKQFKTEFVT